MAVHTIDLDDVEGLLSADRDALLRAAAMAGASVRAVSQAQAEGVLESLADLRPRAVVIVAGSQGPARHAAELIIATIAPRIDVPLIVVPRLPGWIGPLDVVVIMGDDAGQPDLVDAAMRALRRRAELVVAVPVEGPLHDAIGHQRHIDLSPRLHVDERFGFCRFVAVLLAVCAGLTAVRLTPPPPDLASIADRLDEEAAADHPAQESFHNQAKLLAARIGDDSVAWAGDTAGTAALAVHAAAVAFAVAGIVSQATSEAVLGARLRDRATAVPATHDIFYDPDFDPPREKSFRGILMTTSARTWHAEQRFATSADVAVIADALGDATAAGEAVPGAGEAMTDAPADLAAYLVLALRAELAAVFVRLMGDAAT